MGKSYDSQRAIHLISQRSRVQEAREDTTALLLCKLTHIVQDNGRPLQQLMDEIAHDPRRAEQVIHSLVGLVVQYSEKAGGFLPLCNYLVNVLPQEQMPGLAEMDRKWVT